MSDQCILHLNLNYIGTVNNTAQGDPCPLVKGRSENFCKPSKKNYVPMQLVYISLMQSKVACTL